MEADILQDDSLRDGMWGAYDIARIVAETRVADRGPCARLQAYMEWIAAQRGDIPRTAAAP